MVVVVLCLIAIAYASDLYSQSTEWLGGIDTTDQGLSAVFGFLQGIPFFPFTVVYIIFIFIIGVIVYVALEQLGDTLVFDKARRS